MLLLDYIVWNQDPSIIEIFGREIRYYGLFFVAAFLISQYIMSFIFKHESKDVKDVESLTMHVMLGTIIGARLGHCFFYDFDYYVLQNPIKIFYIWEGGLASHGGAIGILTGLYLFVRKKKYNYLWIVDRIVIVVAISGFCIRMGNLMNSEIVGLQTDVPWAFQFVRNDCPPPYDCEVNTIPARHPAQLYEALSCLLIFGALMMTYLKTEIKEYRGRLLGIFLIILFTLRFFYEFLKENQSAFEDNLSLNMGQILSIPFVLAGIYFLATSKKKSIS